MLRSRRVHWLVAVAALAGLGAVATVVVDKRYGGLAQPDPAVFLRSLVDEPPEGAVPDELVTPDAALVAGHVLTVHGWASCAGGAVAEVAEGDTQVSVRIHSYLPVDPDPTDDLHYGCIPEGNPIAALVELDRPLGDRRLVDTETGDPIPTMDAADVLRPAYLPPGWWHVRTSVSAPTPARATVSN